MELEEKIEDLRNIAIKGELSKDGIPDDVISIINNIKNQLRQICEQKGINFPSVVEYIETQFDTYKRSNLKQIGEKRKSIEMQNILRDINQIKSAIENGIDPHHVIEEKEDEDTKEARNTTQRILGDVSFIISDTISQQRRTLDIRRFPQRMIEELSYEIKDRMEKFIRVNCYNEVNGALENDNLRLRRLEEKIIEELEIEFNPQNLSNREQFQEGLREGAPRMEDQAASAQERGISENEKAFIDNEQYDDKSAEQRKGLLEDLFK